jgi:ribosomal protein S18 acetylase RimI-like enzyme
MNIELASEQDLDHILELQRKAFHGQALIYNDFTLPSLTQTIDDLKKEFNNKIFYKVEENGKIVASVRCFINNQTLYVEKLIVDPDFQNKGLGTAIMQEIENRYSVVVNRYELSTGHKSARNLHLYKKLGYKEIRQEPLNDKCNLIFLAKSVVNNCK